MKEKMLNMLETMYTIRFFDQRAKELFREGMIWGHCHPYIGEEAVAVGVCSTLRKDDYVASTHRGHGHCIAKGGDLKRALAELFGRETGYCRGRGGSMHVVDPEIGLLGANGIVGGGIPHAVGAAYAAKYRGTDQVAVGFFGDGASNQGTFHESLNMASLWKLPVIFVCENNHYAATTHVKDSTCVPDIAARAAGYCVPGKVVDGMDVMVVYEAAKEAVNRARNGEGPSLIECKTYRYEPHCMFLKDNLLRPEGEEQSFRCRDAIECFEKRLLEEKLTTPEEVEKIRTKARAKIAEAEAFARESKYPDPAEFQQEYEWGNWQCVR